MNVFSIIGLHHSGKTTAAENLIAYIKSTGQSISSIKDIHQEGFTMEKHGSNSHRHLTASNTCVFARGQNETYLIWNRQLKFKEMLSHINTQWLIIEGMREIPLPKIIAAKNTDEIDQLLDDNVFAITGIVSESINEYKGLPVINAISKTNQLGELVLQKVFKALPFANEGYCGHCGFSCYELTTKILKNENTRADCGLKSSKQITIKFNDEDVVLNEWVQELSIDMITAFCKNLKGYKQGDRITILIDK
jgi:molybdopterin-guanine dinucleotide biosynthesis protein B